MRFFLKELRTDGLELTKGELTAILDTNTFIDATGEKNEPNQEYSPQIQDLIKLISTCGKESRILIFVERKRIGRLLSHILNI